MKAAAGSPMKIVAQTAPQVLHSILTSTIKPGEDRCDRLVAVIQQYAIVHEAADAHGLHRMDDAEPARHLSKSFLNGFDRKRGRPCTVQLQFPPVLDEFDDFELGSEQGGGNAAARNIEAKNSHEVIASSRSDPRQGDRRAPSPDQPMARDFQRSAATAAHQTQRRRPSNSIPPAIPKSTNLTPIGAHAPQTDNSQFRQIVLTV